MKPSKSRMELESSIFFTFGDLQMSFDSTVSLPRSYHSAEAKRSYQDGRSAYIREIIQNSRDAGASSINITLTDTTEPDGTHAVAIHCFDNGCGMDEKIVREKLMALGETTKDEPGMTGGFGVAKILLFFAQLRYEIRSNYIRVRGEGGNYSVTTLAERSPGTTLSVTLNPEVFGAYMLAADLSKIFRQVIEKSYLPKIAITINGEVIASLLKRGRQVAAVQDGVTIHRKKSECKSTYAMTRVRGLWMFDTYVGESDYQLIVEVENYSTTVFTSNRDGFRGGVDRDVRSAINELVLNSSSGTKEKVHYYAGKNDRVSPSLVRAVADVTQNLKNMARELGTMAREQGALPNGLIGEICASALSKETTFSPEESKRLLGAISEQIKINMELKNPTNSDLEDFFKSIEFSAPGLVRDFDLSHHYYVVTKGSYRKVPKSWRPEEFTPWQRDVLEMWSAVIGLVIRDAGLDNRRFNVGYVLDDGSEGATALAEYVRLKTVGEKERDDDVFLLNPLAYGDEGRLPRGIKRRRELILWLKELACHEVAHYMGNRYHNEAFVSAEAEVSRKTLTKLDDYLALVKGW